MFRKAKSTYLFTSNVCVGIFNLFTINRGNDRDLSEYFSQAAIANYHELGGLKWLSRWLSGKEPICQCRRCGFDPWVRKIPWRRKWQPTPVFLPGKSHGWRNLTGCSPWGHEKLDMTEPLSTAHTGGLKQQKLIL